MITIVLYQSIRQKQLNGSWDVYYRDLTGGTFDYSAYNYISTTYNFFYFIPSLLVDFSQTSHSIHLNQVWYQGFLILAPVTVICSGKMCDSSLLFQLAKFTTQSDLPKFQFTLLLLKLIKVSVYQVGVLSRWSIYLDLYCSDFFCGLNFMRARMRSCYV